MSICSNKKKKYSFDFKVNKKAIEALPDKGEIKADRELEV